MKTRAALICLVLAGCGGGGSDEPAAVSASPQPAATPAHGATPDPAPPSSAAAPTPVPLAPVVPPPQATPPAAPPSAPPPASAPPAEPPPETVKGIVLATAFSSDTVYRWGPFATVRRADGGPWIYLYQFAGYSITSIKRDLDDPQPFAPLKIDVPMVTSFGVSFGTAITAGVPDGPVMQMTSGPEHAQSARLIGPDEDVPIVGELVRWSAGPEYIRVLISDSGADGFNICWHSEMAAYKRLMCNVFARSDGAWRGAYMFDDPGGGAIEYQMVR